MFSWVRGTLGDFSSPCFHSWSIWSQTKLKRRPSSTRLPVTPQSLPRYSVSRSSPKWDGHWSWSDGVHQQFRWHQISFGKGRGSVRNSSSESQGQEALMRGGRGTGPCVNSEILGVGEQPLLFGVDTEVCFPEMWSQRAGPGESASLSTPRVNIGRSSFL